MQQKRERAKQEEKERVKVRQDNRVREMRQEARQKDRETEMKDRTRSRVTLEVKSWADMHSKPPPAPPRPTVPSYNPNQYGGYRAKKTAAAAPSTSGPKPSIYSGSRAANMAYMYGRAQAQAAQAESIYGSHRPYGTYGRPGSSQDQGSNPFHSWAGPGMGQPSPFNFFNPQHQSSTSNSSHRYPSPPNSAPPQPTPPPAHMPVIVRLLRHLHEIFPDPDAQGSEVLPGRDVRYTFTTQLNERSSPADIKRAYLRAVRLVHPDKQKKKPVSPSHKGGDREALELHVLAEEVSTLLHQSYQDYTSKSV